MNYTLRMHGESLVFSAKLMLTSNLPAIMSTSFSSVHGKEGSLTLPSRFDFHAECRGMRYENISKLVSQLERTFEQQGSDYLTHVLFKMLNGLIAGSSGSPIRSSCHSKKASSE